METLLELASTFAPLHPPLVTRSFKLQLQDRADLESRCLDSDPPNMSSMQHGEAVGTSIGSNVPVQENDATYKRQVASILATHAESNNYSNSAGISKEDI